MGLRRRLVALVERETNVREARKGAKLNASAAPELARIVTRRDRKNANKVVKRYRFGTCRGCIPADFAIFIRWTIPGVLDNPPRLAPGALSGGWPPVLSACRRDNATARPCRARSFLFVAECTHRIDVCGSTRRNQDSDERDRQQHRRH